MSDETLDMPWLDQVDWTLATYGYPETPLPNGGDVESTQSQGPSLPPFIDNSSVVTSDFTQVALSSDGDIFGPLTGYTNPVYPQAEYGFTFDESTPFSASYALLLAPSVYDLPYNSSASLGGLNPTAPSFPAPVVSYPAAPVATSSVIRNDERGQRTAQKKAKKSSPTTRTASTSTQYTTRLNDRGQYVARKAPKQSSPGMSEEAFMAANQSEHDEPAEESPSKKPKKPRRTPRKKQKREREDTPQSRGQPSGTKSRGQPPADMGSPRPSRKKQRQHQSVERLEREQMPPGEPEIDDNPPSPITGLRQFRAYKLESQRTSKAWIEKLPSPYMKAVDAEELAEKVDELKERLGTRMTRRLTLGKANTLRKRIAEGESTLAKAVIVRHYKTKGELKFNGYAEYLAWLNEPDDDDDDDVKYVMIGPEPRFMMPFEEARKEQWSIDSFESQMECCKKEGDLKLLQRLPELRKRAEDKMARLSIRLPEHFTPEWSNRPCFLDVGNLKPFLDSPAGRGLR